MAHKITSITITNFKSIVSETFPLNDFTAIVGPNNAGKSNILHASKWLLRKASLGVECFHDVANPIIVEGKIDGIDQALLQTLATNHRASISQYLVNGTLFIRRVQNAPGDGVANTKLFVKDTTTQNPADEWANNPTGIDNAITSIFPEPIFIGAMENSEEDVSKQKAGTTIGKLLAEIIEPIEQQHGAAVNQALQGLKDLLDADGLTRAPELINFDQAVNPKIDSFFPNVSLKIHVPTPEIKEVFKQGTIKVYEPNFATGREVGSLGHGAQRAIQMALIRHLADNKRATANQGARTLLLIDEPELYLHPQAIELVRESLKTLSQHGYQVLFTTHSPLMVTTDDILNTLIITKAHPAGTQKRQTLSQAITQAIQDNPSQINLMFTLTNSAQILFAEKIILVEGTTENRLFPKVFECLNGRSLGYHKYALINQGSVSNTRKCFDVLNALGLPAKAIVDLDYAFTLAAVDGFLQANDPDISACKTFFQQIAAANNITLNANNLPQKNPQVTAARGYEILAQHAPAQPYIENLFQKLLAHNIWVWKNGAIEVHFGLAAKTEAAWATYANQLKTQPINQVITDHAGVVALVTWLTQ